MWCKNSTSLQFTHYYFQHRRTLTDFLPNPAPIFKDLWNVLDLPNTNGSLQYQTKVGHLCSLLHLTAPPLSLTQHMHLTLHRQNNDKMQE